MKKLIVPMSASALALAFAASTAHAQTSPLVPNSLTVIVYGKVNTPLANNTYLDGQATPISIEQFPLTVSAGADSGTPLLTETLPTTGTGAQVGLVGEYGSSSEGTILVSGDGRFLTFGGYDGNLAENGAPSGGYGGSNTAEAQSTCANVPRVSALLNIATGTLDSSTISNDIYNTNNPRGVYTQNGSSFYLSGQGAGASDEGGRYLDAFGNNTTTGGSAPTGIFNKESTRTVSAWNIDAANGVASTTPNLYYAADQNSSSKGTLTGLFEYTGLPTSSEGSSSGTRITPVTATIGGKTVNLSPQGYFFANPTTLYIADTGDPKAGGTGAGGIQKWGFNGSSWVLLYEFANPSGFVAPASATSVSHGETGMEALAGQVVNGVASLYAVSYTAGDADPNGLYGVTDTVSFTTSAQASGESVVQLAASATDMNFKGVAITPAAAAAPLSEPTMPQWALMGLAALLFAFAARFLPASRR
jgi:hypothetical protein